MVTKQTSEDKTRISLREAAKILNVTYERARQLCREGILDEKDGTLAKGAVIAFTKERAATKLAIARAASKEAAIRLARAEREWRRVARF